MTGRTISGADFYDLIQSGDKWELDRISHQLVDGMALYLRSVYKVDPQLAEELAHQSFHKVYQRVIDGLFDEKQNLYGYLITTVKHQYFKYKNREQDGLVETNPDLDQSPGSSDLVDTLFDDERKRILMSCIERLDRNSRNFVFQMLRHIKETDEKAAEILDMSHSAFRTRKSRMIHILHECVRRKYAEKRIDDQNR